MQNSEHDDIENTPILSIADRVDKGLKADSHADGGIVPFPSNIDGGTIRSALSGKEQKYVEKLIAARYKLTVYEYRSADGSVIQLVLRFDHNSEPKEIRPLRYIGRSKHGGHMYWMNAIDGIKPLFGLDQLKSRPQAPVLVVEGEKTALAAQAIFPDHVVITWMSGASNVRNTEMLALEGREIVLWPDNDPPGRKAMRTFAAFAYAAGATSVAMIDVPTDFPEKWDLADSIPDGASEDTTLDKLLAEARNVNPSDVALLSSDARQKAEQRRLLGHRIGYTKVPLDEAIKALQLLDADMYAGPWRQLARTLYHAYGDAALEAFDEWSRLSNDDKYRKGEPAKMWEGFAKEDTFRANSLASVFRWAKKILYDRTKGHGSGKPNVELSAEAIVIASIEEINENHAVVVRGGKTVVLWENYDPRFDRFTETYLSKRDFYDRIVRMVELPEDDERQTKKGGKRINQGVLWFDSGRRRSFDDVVFSPGKVIGAEYLNLWRGFNVIPTNDPNRWSRLKQHLLDNVSGGDKDSYDYLMNWLAFAVQHLNEPIGVAIVLIGEKGAGKSIVTDLFGHLFGEHAFVTSRMEDALGKFNDRLESTILLGLEEAVAPNSKAADGVLKDIITRKTLSLEGKFFRGWSAPNHLRIIVTSNNDHVVRADGSERRYAVFDVINPYQSDPGSRRKYFGQMVEQMETGGYEAMLGELLARDIRDWNPEIIPETAALKRQKIINLQNNPVAAYIFERLSDGIWITTGGVGSANPLYAWSEDSDVQVPVRQLIEDYRVFCVAHGMQFNERQFTMKVTNFMPDSFKSTTRRINEVGSSRTTERVYRFPPLEVARKHFENATGIHIERES